MFLPINTHDVLRGSDRRVHQAHRTLARRTMRPAHHPHHDNVGAKAHRNAAQAEDEQLHSMADDDTERIETTSDPTSDVEAPPSETDPLVPPHQRVALDRLRNTVRKVIATRALAQAGEGTGDACGPRDRCSPTRAEHRKRFGVPKPENTLFGSAFKANGAPSADGEVGIIEWTATECKQCVVLSCGRCVCRAYLRMFPWCAGRDSRPPTLSPRRRPPTTSDGSFATAATQAPYTR